MTVLRTDFVAYNRLGVQVRSFNELDRARAWVRANAMFHDGLYLQEVQVIARPIYRPRPPRLSDFSIPAMPA